VEQGLLAENKIFCGQKQHAQTMRVSDGSDVGPGLKRGARATKTVHEKISGTKKLMCSKLSAVLATANFQQKTRVCRF
jgi:hypothetical protein